MYHKESIQMVFTILKGSEAFDTLRRRSMTKGSTGRTMTARPKLARRPVALERIDDS